MLGEFKNEYDYLKIYFPESCGCMINRICVVYCRVCVCVITWSHSSGGLVAFS